MRPVNSLRAQVMSNLVPTTTRSIYCASLRTGSSSKCLFCAPLKSGHMTFCQLTDAPEGAQKLILGLPTICLIMSPAI